MVRRIIGIILVLTTINGFSVLLSKIASIPESLVFQIIILVIGGIIGAVVLLFISQLIMGGIVQNADASIRCLKITGICLIVIQIPSILWMIFINPQLVPVSMIVLNIIYGILFIVAFFRNEIDRPRYM